MIFEMPPIVPIITGVSFVFFYVPHGPYFCCEVFIFSYCYYYCYYGRHSSVGIATRYGLDGPGIEPQGGGRDFPHPSRPALGPTQPAVQWVRVFPGGKAAGAWC